MSLTKPERAMHLFHERINLVLGRCERGGCAHAGVHDLGVNIEVLKQVFKLPHGGRDLREREEEEKSRSL